jgi:hypothetical protein
MMGIQKMKTTRELGKFTVMSQSIKVDFGWFLELCQFLFSWSGCLRVVKRFCFWFKLHCPEVWLYNGEKGW